MRGGADGRAPAAVKPREPASEAPAAQEFPVLLLDEPRQRVPAVRAGRLGAERLEVIADHLIQDALRRRLRRVDRGRAAHAPGVAKDAPQTPGRDRRLDSRSRRGAAADGCRFCVLGGARRSRNLQCSRGERASDDGVGYRCDQRDRRRRGRVRRLRSAAGTIIRTSATRPAITSHPSGVTVSVRYWSVDIAISAAARADSIHCSMSRGAQSRSRPVVESRVTSDLPDPVGITARTSRPSRSARTTAS